MNNNFITLTNSEEGTTVILNVNFIQSIIEYENGSFIIMTFKEEYSQFIVKETPKEIMKLMKNKIYQ